MSAQYRKVLIVKRPGNDGYNVMFESVATGATISTQVPDNIGEELISRITSLVLDTLIQRGFIGNKPTIRKGK